MAIVLAFLLGMPLIAIPQVSTHLALLLRAKPPESRGSIPTPVPESEPFDDPTQLAESTITNTPLEEHDPAHFVPPNPDDLAATIEALKLQFVEAGVSYMTLEKIGTDAATYQFRFDVPVVEGSAYTKRFQVVDDVPDEAMRRALKELRRWRVAGRQPAHLERPTVFLR